MKYNLNLKTALFTLVASAISSVLNLNISIANSDVYFKAVPKTITFNITASDIGTVKTYSEDIKINQVITKLVQEKRQCSIIQCDEIPANPKKGDWKNYFNVPKNKKAEALAEAILGIGEKTAQRIIDAGYFKSKPQTWYEFSREIKNAQKTLKQQGYNFNFEDLVLNVYGEENAKNLGYYSSQSCSLQYYECTALVEKKYEEFYKYAHVTGKIQVKEAKLQPFEVEKIKLTITNVPGDVYLSGSLYNEYNQETIIGSDGNSFTTLTATKRIKNILPDEAIKATLYKDQQGLYLVISANDNYIPKNYEPTSTLRFTYDVCRENWFGGCFEVVRDLRYIEIQNKTHIIRLNDGKYKEGSKYYVRYKYKRMNSQYYLDQYGLTYSTNTVRY